MKQVKKQADQKQQKTRPSSGHSEQLNADDEKKRKFFIRQTIYFVYYLTRITLTIAILIFLNEKFIQQLKQTDSFQRMQQNIALWKQDAVINITIVNSYNCPEGYQTYSAYDWPGTKQGCYCSAKLGTWDYIKILQGACSELAISAGCLKIQPISKIPFLFWKKNQLICLKRIKNLNFFTDLQNLSIPIHACSQDKNYRFEIPHNLSNLTACPLTSIQNNNQLQFPLSEIGFSYSRQTDYPIIKLKMTEYEFCPDFKRQNISPFKQRNRNYNLQNIVKEYCPGKDQRVIMIDEQGQDQLFNNNLRINDATSRLPAYPEPMEDYRYKLGFIRYPEWKYSCRKSELFNLFITESNLNLQEFSSYSYLCKAFSSIFCVFYGLLFSIFYLYRKITQIYYKKQQNLLYENLKQIQRRKPNLYEKIHKTLTAQLIIFGLKLLLALILVAILAVYEVRLIDYFDWLKQSQQCTNNLMAIWIQNYKEYIQIGQRLILLCLVLIMTLICIDIIMICWRTFKQDLKLIKQQSIANIFDEELQEKQIENRTMDQGQILKGKYHKNNIEEILETEENFLEENKNNLKKTLARPKRNFRKKRIMSTQMSDFTDQLNF